LQLEQEILYGVVVPCPEYLVSPVVVSALCRGLLLRQHLVVLESSAFCVSLLRPEVVMSAVLALAAVPAALLVLAVFVLLALPVMLPLQ